jgi:hypothetical protein
MPARGNAQGTCPSIYSTLKGRRGDSSALSGRTHQFLNPGRCPGLECGGAFSAEIHCEHSVPFKENVPGKPRPCRCKPDLVVGSTGQSSRSTPELETSRRMAPRIHRGHLILLSYSKIQSAGAFFAGAFLPGPFLVGAAFSSGRSSALTLALSHVSRNGDCE